MQDDIIEYPDRFGDVLTVDSAIFETPVGVEVSFQIQDQQVVLIRPQIVKLVEQLQVYLEKTQ